jgi:uncharacterized protein (DUF1778 family)
MKARETHMSSKTPKHRDHTVELSKRDSAALLAMLDKPSRPNAALRRAAKRHREVTKKSRM